MATEITNALDGLTQLLRPLNGKAAVEKVDLQTLGTARYNEFVGLAAEFKLPLADLYVLSFTAEAGLNWAAEELGWLVSVDAVEFVQVSPYRLLLSFLPQEA